MSYKILETHIQFNVATDLATPHIVVVAIQSDTKEKEATHFKAYWKHVAEPLNEDVLQRVAAQGEKVAKGNAYEIFPSLGNLGYY